MKTVILGNGFVASHLPYTILKDRIQPTHGSIEDFLIQHAPDVVINCIGYCGKANIDDCEQNKDRAINTNTLIPLMMAEVCEKRGIRLVHIGSGCIFYGSNERSFNGDWREDDGANPKSTYSRSKYAADLLLERMPSTTILRIRMPLSWKRSPRNLISKLIGYPRVLEEPNSMTLMTDLSRAVEWAIREDKRGIYHITSEKPVLHSQILREYQKYHPEHVYESISARELEGMVLAPRSNCILNGDLAREEGLEFDDQDAAIQDYVRRYCQDE